MVLVLRGNLTNFLMNRQFKRNFVLRCARSMLANRISYTMGVTGPSFLTDTACSSSMYALDCAFNAIRCGECEAALVGGSNLLLHPYTTLQFAR